MTIPEPMHYPDHFVVGIDDLATGIEMFEAQSGVKAAPGGFHPHIGTCNALLSLGAHAYLEIIAPYPAAEIEKLDAGLSAKFLDPLAGMQALTPYLWAVGSRDLDHTVRLLSEQGITLSTPQRGSRTRPDGTLIEWRACFVTAPDFTGAPFFIEWLDPSNAPPATAPGGCTLEGFSISGPDFELLDRAVQTLGLECGTAFSNDLAMQITLGSPNGNLVLASR